MPCPRDLRDRHPIRRARVRDAIPRSYRHVDRIELRLDLRGQGRRRIWAGRDRYNVKDRFGLLLPDWAT